jgi:DeoR family fructose operon transcriptional repressor
MTAPTHPSLGLPDLGAAPARLAESHYINAQGSAGMASDNTDSRAPYADERKNHILERLRSSGRLEAVEVAEALGVTGETIRKDLIQLERQGLLRRVYGGAVPVHALAFEPAVEARKEFMTEKTRIARAALAHLPEQGSVLIDAGSTTAKLVELFPGDRELTVYTNTLPLASSLLTRPRLTVFTLGGRLRSKTFAEVGDWPARALAEINVDVAFLGTNGISLTRGLTTPDPAEAAIKRLMVGCARRRILLADHSKFGVISGTKHAELSDIDLLITDSGMTDDQSAQLQQAGMEVQRT